MTVQLKYQKKDTAVLRYPSPLSNSNKAHDIYFLAKCGIIELMDQDHPSLSELYKIRYNEHGGLQLNDYQKILKKRLTALIKDIKEYEDLQLHILIPQYQGNYFNFLVLISSLVPFTKSMADTGSSKRAFSSYDNFTIQHSNIIPLQIDEMKDSDLQKLLKIAFKEQNNGDFEFHLSIDITGIPDFLYEQYRVELGVHEIEVLQNIVNSQVRYYNLPRIQLNDRYARSIGWDMNDQIISITEPRKIASFGNERIILQVFFLLQSFHLKHNTRTVEVINPYNGNRSDKQEVYLECETSYLIFTTKAAQWEKSLQILKQQSDCKYKTEITTYFHKLEELGIDLIQLLSQDKNILIKILRSWINLTTSEQSASYEFESLLELFDDLFKIYGQEQLNEFQLRMFLKDSTLNDLFHQDLQNNLLSKFSSILSHPFFNFKEKFDPGVNNSKRRLWKSDFISKGIHVIDISGSTQLEQMAFQSFFLILQEVRYLDDTWTFHSFDEGLRHSFEKVEQILKEISVNRSLLHFTHTTEMPSFLRSNDLLLFDREFSTYSVLKSFGANSLFEDSANASLMVYEQTNTSLLKPIEIQTLDILYDRNVLVKLSPDDINFPHDLTPAKQIEPLVIENPSDTTEEEVISDDSDFVESIISQPFAEEEDKINEEYEEDKYIGPDLLFKVPVMASFRNYRQYHFQDIEFASNLPRDMVETQLQHLLSLKWIETSIYEKKDVYLPLKKGKGYVDNLMDQVPDLKDIQEEIFDLVYHELDVDVEEKIINQSNIIEVLIAIRLSYHSLTEYEERRGLLLKLSSICKYVSDGFEEFNDELESYYYWSLGILAAFHGTQLGSKRDEHLLIRKITEITKAISDLLTDKLQYDFSMKQVETNSDELYVFTETIKEDEKEDKIESKKSIDPRKVDTPIEPLKLDDTSVEKSIEKTVEKSIEKTVEKPIEKTIEKIVLEKAKPIPKTLPSVLNIPKAASKKSLDPLLKRQLTPSELRPITMSPELGSWYKYHRKDYEEPVSVDPMVLGADDIIFAFMVNSILNNFSSSSGIKKRKHSLMFLNREQLEETVARSPLPLKVKYNNLIESGIIEKIDVGYTILDIRTVLPVPNVSVDPMFKRMSLDEILSLIEENPHYFTQSRTLQSYIFADHYDMELQPVVAICYALLIDKGDAKEKINNFEKFIPWAYTLIKLFMMKKRHFMKSNTLEYIHETLLTELKRIHVGTSLELLKYSGEDEIAIKLKFLVYRKLKRLGLTISDIDKYSRNRSIDEEELDNKSVESENINKKKEKKDRVFFSPSLMQQLEQDGLDEVNTKHKSVKKVEKMLPKKTTPSKKSPKKPKKRKISPSGNTTISSASNTSDENIPFDKAIITKIEGICDVAINNAENISPTELLVSLFYDVIYPGIIGNTSLKKDLQLIEYFNEIGELTGVSNTVDFSRNLGDMQGRWDKFTETRGRVIKSFVKRIKETSSNFVYNELFRDLLRTKIKRESK